MSTTRGKDVGWDPQLISRRDGQISTFLVGKDALKDDGSVNVESGIPTWVKLLLGATGIALIVFLVLQLITKVSVKPFDATLASNTIRGQNYEYSQNSSDDDDDDDDEQQSTEADLLSHKRQQMRREKEIGQGVAETLFGRDESEFSPLMKAIRSGQVTNSTEFFGDNASKSPLTDNAGDNRPLTLLDLAKTMLQSNEEAGVIANSMQEYHPNVNVGDITSKLFVSKLAQNGQIEGFSPSSDDDGEVSGTNNGATSLPPLVGLDVLKSFTSNKKTLINGSAAAPFKTLGEEQPNVGDPSNDDGATDPPPAIPTKRPADTNYNYIEDGSNPKGDPALRTDIIAKQTQEETDFLNGICGPEMQIKSIGLPGTNQHVHCYVPCGPGYIEKKLSPDSASTDVKKNNQSSYWACEATCPPRLDANGDIMLDDRGRIITTELPNKRECETRSVQRAKVFGWQNVKCAPITFTPDYLTRKGVTFGNKSLHMPKPQSYIAGTVTGPDRTEQTGPFATQMRTENWDWIHQNGYVGVTRNGNHTCTTFFGLDGKDIIAQDEFLPTACGGDADLMFTGPAAYYASVNTVSGYRPRVSCYENCPSGSIMVPEGLLEERQCMEPCPTNTKRSSLNKNSCTKGGFIQQIAVTDVDLLLLDTFRQAPAPKKKPTV